MRLNEHGLKIPEWICLLCAPGNGCNGAHKDTPRFHTKEGWLTPYSLGCGYMEFHQSFDTSKGVDNYTRTRLEVNASGYDVTTFATDGDKSKTPSDAFLHGEYGPWTYYESFETLTEARKEFMRQVREYSYDKGEGRKDRGRSLRIYEANAIEHGFVPHKWDEMTQVRICLRCSKKEAYWDDDGYPIDPCHGERA